MDDAKLIAAIEQQEALAVGQGAIQAERAAAIDRYLGRPYGDEQEGRSQVVMRDVHDTIEWIKPALMKVFASGDEVCKFEPVGPEDEDQAQQETDYINHVLMNKNGGFLVLYDWFHDALLQRNGYVVGVNERESRVQRTRYEGLSDDEFALLAKSEDVEIVEHDETLVMAEDGSTQVAHDCVVRRKREYECTRVRNIPPERVIVAPDWPDVGLARCPFVEVIDWLTLSELREQGYEVDDDISDDSAYHEDLYEEHRREVDGQFAWDREDIEADPATRRVRVRRVWMRYDEDGDGIAELRRIVVVGRTILENEEDDLVPVASLTPHRMPHEHNGLSMADAVADLQRIRTVLVRGFLDSMYLANNGRYGISGSVNLDDMLVSRPGGVVRVGEDGSQLNPAEHIMPLQHTQQGPAILQAIEYVDTVRENRTGVTRYNQGLDADSLNKTATGVNSIMQAAQQRIELIARIFAETGVKDLMLIIHALTLKRSRQAEMVKLRNKWVPVDPSTWQTRSDMTVAVGLGTGNKDQMLQHLLLILQEQKQALPVGLTTPKHIYNTLTRLTQNAGFKVADDFWSDPEQYTPPPAPPSPEQIKAQAEAQKLQFQAQQDQMRFQAEQAAENRRMQLQAMLDQNREEMQARQKMLEAQMAQQAEQARLAFEEWKVEVDAALKLALADKTAQAGIEQENARKVPDLRIDQVLQDMQALMQGMQAMQEEANAPAEIVRGPDGRAVAVRRGGRERMVMRGPDGRAMGIQ